MMSHAWEAVLEPAMSEHRVAARGLDMLVARLEELGQPGSARSTRAGHWWIMQDPEGNEFCAA